MQEELPPEPQAEKKVLVRTYFKDLLRLIILIIVTTVFGIVTISFSRNVFQRFSYFITSLAIIFVIYKVFYKSLKESSANLAEFLDANKK